MIAKYASPDGSPTAQPRRVNEHVKKAVEAANSTRPLPHFNYVPTEGCEPSCRHVPASSYRHSDEVREVLCPNRDSRTPGENRDRSIKVGPQRAHRSSPGQPVKSTTASTLYTASTGAWLGSKSRSTPRGPEARRRVSDILQSVGRTESTPTVKTPKRKKNKELKSLGTRRLGPCHGHDSPAQRLHRPRCQGIHPRRPELGVLPLGLSQTALLHILDVGFKISLSAEDIWRQSRQEFQKEISAFLTSPPIAQVLLLVLEGLLFLFQLLQTALVLSCSLFRLLALKLKVANLPLRASVFSKSRIYLSRVETDGLDLPTLNDQAKAWKTPNMIS
ncbi:LOW QUALITY PROTEIN: hypothetical protein Cgig2_028449 [Carnegiea gigantea]|uniref:Uncharacterized protein n=1 Tax=Carnegiea gigantea TaxID=171969 RepID=A0A9Q1KNH3_9CARY|nr:LOW QUALITY PROTEIN: hypothetical protein Cgig2_028449 [Carnegiea gigantea]